MWKFKLTSISKIPVPQILVKTPFDSDTFWAVPEQADIRATRRIGQSGLYPEVGRRLHEVAVNVTRGPLRTFNDIQNGQSIFSEADIQFTDYSGLSNWRNAAWVKIWLFSAEFLVPDRLTILALWYQSGCTEIGEPTLMVPFETIWA
ncbi:MAG: hypothetical protein ACR2PF_18185 [Rhizobiaceae bacterium]